MCRNIKPLFNYDPPASEEEIAASALQYVRKVSGFTRPSQANQAAFDTAVQEIARVTQTLLESLTTNTAARSREAEAAKARARNQKRFG